MEEMKTFHALTLLARCGGGAYGDVYYCQDLSGKKMALKIIPKKKLGDAWERELKGVIHYRKITENAPSLLQIYHVEEDEDNFFYTMEGADSFSEDAYKADTLAARLENGPIPPTDLFRILSGIFQGIKIIHQAGFAHRDIKPDNILFVKGVPKLADIGLISSLSATMSLLAGTLEFIPPEERTSESSEYTNSHDRKRNDLYAFGKVIYCAVTGNDPKDFPTVPKDLPITLPVKYFLRLAFQLCNKESACRLDSINKLEEEMMEIEKKILTGETLTDRFRYAVRNFLFFSKGGLLLSLKLLKRYWYYALLLLLLGGGTAYMIWKPKPPYDITKEKTKLYTNADLRISMTIPFHWEIISKDIVQKMFQEAYGDGKNKRFTKKQSEAMMQAVKMGQDAIYCNFNTDFADNIMITAAPIAGEDIQKLSVDEFRCLLKTLFEGQLGFKTEIYTVKKITIQGLPALFIDYSYMPFCRANGYWIDFEDKTIMITLTAQKARFQKRQEEFKSVLSTLKIGEK